jgi:hypothetical protein
MSTTRGEKMYYTFELTNTEYEGLIELGFGNHMAAAEIAVFSKVFTTNRYINFLENAAEDLVKTLRGNGIDTNIDFFD